MDERPGESLSKPNYPLEIDADDLADRPASSTPSRVATPRHPAPPRPRRGLPWWAGCGLFFIGFVVGVLGLLGGVFLLFGAATASQPLSAPPNVPGTPDIATQLSQTYLNTEIKRNLQGTSIKLLNVATLTGLVLDVRDNQQVLVTARVHTLLGDFDIGITEAVSVQDGQVVVRSTGEPRLGSTTIPINLNDAVNAINTLEVQPQINKYVTNVTVDGRILKLIGLTTTTGIITAKFNVQ